MYQDVYEPGKWNCATRVARWRESLSRVWEYSITQLFLVHLTARLIYRYLKVPNVIIVFRRIKMGSSYIFQVSNFDELLGKRMGR